MKAILRNHNSVIVANAKPTSIECPVMIFTKGDPVIKAIIMKFRKWFNVRSVYNILAVPTDYLQSTKGAMLLI